MKSHRVAVAIFLAGLICSVTSFALATPVTVTIPGTGSIWLANQPDGTINLNDGGRVDTAPANSPVLVALLCSPYDYLTFQSTGGTTRDSGLPLVGSEGEQAFEALPSVFSLSGLAAPFSSLVGVFLHSDNTSAVPPTLSFATEQERSFTTLSPQLQQVFFIGDGLTGVGTGDLQKFVIPFNADTLYLATFDSGSYNNFGELQVTINGKIAPVPEPSTLLLLGSGLAGLGGMAWRRHRRG